MLKQLLHPKAEDISERVRLFKEGSDASFPIDTADPVVQEYHTKCGNILQSKLDAISVKMASVTAEDDDSIPLADTEEFVMEPEDPSVYMTNGLSLEHEITDAILSGSIPIDTAVITTANAGDNIMITLTATYVNPNPPFPFSSISIKLDLPMYYSDINNYRGTQYQGFCTLTYHDLYRGPVDNVDDRGANYYIPVETSCDPIELTDWHHNVLFRHDTGTWSLLAGDHDHDEDYTLDIGSTGHFNIDLQFTLTQGTGKFTGSEQLDMNASVYDLNGSVLMPKYQWSSHTRSQSPNTLAAMAGISSAEKAVQSDLYKETIKSEIDTEYDESIDALAGGDAVDKTSILDKANSILDTAMASIKAKSITALKAIGQQGLARAVFEDSVDVGLSNIGIELVVPSEPSESFLEELDAELKTKGIDDFQIAPGVYDFYKIPAVIPIQEASRFAKNVFSRISSFDDTMNDPATKWIANDFEIIERDIFDIDLSLNAII